MTTGTHRGRLLERLCETLAESVGPTAARSIATMALRRCRVAASSLEDTGLTAPVLEEIRRGVEWFCKDRRKLGDTLAKLGALTPATSPEQEQSAISIEIDVEEAIVVARSRARLMAQELGFNHTDQVKIATAVSEVARNIFRYAATGRVTLTPLDGGEHGMLIEAEDEGPGIEDVQSVLAGGFRSDTGLGLGIHGCRNLMDEFFISTDKSRGTHIRMKKLLT